MRPFTRELSLTDPVAVFAPLAHLPYSILFDSADRAHPDARYSFIASHPIETLEYKDGEMRITNWDAQVLQEGEPFAIIQSRLEHWVGECEHVEGLPPFQGGLAGYFGYDLGRALEDLPDQTERLNGQPDLAFGIYDQVIAFDHHTDKSWIITHAPDAATAKRKQDYLIDLIGQGEDIAQYSPNRADIAWRSNFSKPQYMASVARVIEYIRAGDIFQANFSQRFNAALPEDFDVFAHYCNLRRVNRAPFAAFMNCEGYSLSCASPERFLTVQKGKVETKPIKGTRPRVSDAQLDQRYKDELVNSEKERAENTMIVDLLRNDLSKVCVPSSVNVSALCALESFASVHHLVSTVRAELSAGQSALDLMRAAFPGGSITGAPKVRAMEIIEELEPTKRGAYCGAFAYVGFDGTMDSNILIRTLVFEGDEQEKQVSFQVGGGIVADSEPDAEYQETLDKAAGMFGSF